jgi:hypothetical protein
MAVSEIRTWLSLDEWFVIMGINPLHANSLSSTLFDQNACGSVWFQYSWQNSDRIGRDDLAMAIQEAEQEISKEVGYNLMPDWTIEERLPYPKPLLPEMYNLTGTNVRSMMKSVELTRGHVISGGMRAKSIVGRSSAVVRSDPNGDTYSELCTVTVATTVTDTNEIHVFYTGHDGDDAWEIRPIKVSISAGIATITFNSWQIVDEHTITDMNATAINGDIAGSYETTVDVYRVYNDPATQVQFLWENALDCCSTCVACTLGSQAGCFHLREPRLGITVPAPATWNAADEAFDAGYWSACREPDQVRFWYYSGYQDKNITRYNAQMGPYWKYAVAFFAASKLDRPVCGCSNVSQFIDRWRTDVMANKFGDGTGMSINVTPEQLSNRLGSTYGALYAWKRIHQNGVRVLK